MHKTYLYLALALMMAMPLQAGRLTVVVAVDGLDATALKEMQPYWQQGGLRTLSEEAYQTTVTFSHWLYGGDEALATLLTGVNPSMHGVCSNYAFNRETRRVEDIFQSDKSLGIGTDLSYSASPLLASTVSDRLRLNYGADTRIYAIGQKPTSTVLLAGHAANACCWLDKSVPTDSLRWVSTSYYKEGLPAAADKMNIDGSLTHILSHEWTPRMEMTTYLHATDEEKKHGFSYTLSSLQNSSALARSLLPSTFYLLPNFNTAVVELALAMQKDKNLGKGLAEDVLLLQLTVCTPQAQQAALRSAEQEDMYIRLNQDLGYLMEQLEKRIGRDALRMVVMGVPRLGVNTTMMAEYNMPLQILSMDRVVALTSTYLMALYGHERWIDGGWGHSIFLNRMLIEQKHMNLETIRRQVADFLMEFEGIRFACPASEAYLYPDMNPSLHKRFIGDVVFELQSNYCLSPITHHPSPIFIWSGARNPFPPALHNATEVANYIF